MKETLLHTPQGVRDIYGTECKKRLKVMDRLHEVLQSYSYTDIETPTIEFFNLFNRDRGSAESNEMFKLFDRDNNTLVLVPDKTPSIARSVAKYYAEEDLPIRLCYQGKTFTNEPKLQGKLNEVTEIGVELINDDSSAADAEIIATIIDCFKAVNLNTFQIEIGDVEFFKGLIEEANLDDETEKKLRTYIQNKNFFGLNEYVESLSLKPELKEAFSNYGSLFGDLDMLYKAKTYVSNERSLNAIKRLEKVYHALEFYNYQDHIGFDLGMLNRYNYYTGIIFRGYTYGTGDAIVKGGRYNSLLEQFGKKAPSIGFGIMVDELMMALSRQKIDIEVENTNNIVLYQARYQGEAIKLAHFFRQNGMKVELIRQSSRHPLDDYISHGKNNQFHSLYSLVSEEIVEIYDLDHDKLETVSYSSLIDVNKDKE